MRKGLTLLICLFVLTLGPMGQAAGQERQDDRPAWHGVQPASTGHPLLQADPNIWLPVFQETNSTEAAVDAVRPDDEWLHELGDIDGDGRADLLRFRAFDGDEAYETVEAISGDDHRVLWDYEVGEGYAYVTGDIDEDGIQDIAHVRNPGVSFPVTVTPAGYSYEGDYVESVTILRGADGSEMFQTDLTGYVRFESNGGGTPVGSASTYESEFLIPLLTDRSDGQPGADVVYARLGTESTSGGVFALVAYAYAYAYNSHTSVRVERLTASGDLAWSSEEDGGDTRTSWIYGVGDVTGDGVDDFLLGATDSYRYGYVVSPAGFQSAAAPSTVFRATLIDGQDGSTAWQYETEPFLGEGGAIMVGDTHGQGPEVAVFQFIMHPDRVDTTITRLDGARGAVLDQQTHEDDLRIYWEYGDVQADGDDEVIYVQADPGAPDPVAGGVYVDESDLSVSIAEPDGAAIWTLDLSEGEPYLPQDPDWAPDFDGDGLGDVAFWGEGSIIGRSGATGELLWETPAEGVLGVLWIDDIDGDGGHDLAFLRFPGKSMDDDEFADATGLVELMRGRDGARIWQKTAWDPDQNQNATAPFPMFLALNAGDTNGDGIDDVILDLDAYSFMGIVCTPEGCREIEQSDPLLRVTLLADGATGQTLYAYRPLGKESAEGAGPADVELGDAGKELAQSLPDDQEQAPGLPVLAVLAALALLVRRRD